MSDERKRAWGNTHTRKYRRWRRMKFIFQTLLKSYLLVDSGFVGEKNLFKFRCDALFDCFAQNLLDWDKNWVKFRCGAGPRACSLFSASTHLQWQRRMMIDDRWAKCKPSQQMCFYHAITPPVCQNSKLLRLGVYPRNIFILLAGRLCGGKFAEKARKRRSSLGQRGQGGGRAKKKRFVVM